jgi:hypothetical protein
MISTIVLEIFHVVLTSIFAIIKFLLLPIDLAIQATMPAISESLTAVGDLFTLIAQSLGWAISASGIPPVAISILASMYIYKIALPLGIWFFKLGFKWYRAIRR